MSEETNHKSSIGRKIRAYGALIIVIAAVLSVALYYYRQYTKYYSTDDAYLDADKVSVSSKIPGRIVALYAAEGDSVKSGALLVRLDSSDLVSQRIQAMAARDQAVASLHNADARFEMDQKTLIVQEINLAKAKEDLDRATVQFDGKVIAKEQFDHIKKAYEAAQAQLDASYAQVNVSQVQIESAGSAIKSAEAQIGTIETSLRNARIYSPSCGRIAKRWLLPGDVVQAGQSILTVTKDSLLWVTAFFEETKVGGIHLNQYAEYTIDAFPGTRVFGHVYNIGTNTAAQFSLIPPNNASGNFTKVTQRIPVKITIDKTEDGDPAILHRLVSGMSVVVKIYK